MKMEKKNRLLAALISAAMVFTMMPFIGVRAYADDPVNPAINLVNKGAAPVIGGAQTSNIWFGNYPQSEVRDVGGLEKDKDYVEADGHNFLIEPIKWRVMDNKKNARGQYKGELFLIADKALEPRRYHDNTRMKPLSWEMSTMRSWLNGYDGESNESGIDFSDNSFIGKAFSEMEQGFIPLTIVKNEKTDKNIPNPKFPDLDFGDDTIDRVFLLSPAEAVNENYGFSNSCDSYDTTRRRWNTDYSLKLGAWCEPNAPFQGLGYWWMRGPGERENGVAVVASSGMLGLNGAMIDTNTMSVCPVLNVDIRSAILTSAAVGGKASGEAGAGALEQVGTSSGNGWKLTMKKGHDSFEVKTVSTCDGKTLDIGYSGAVTGKGEYISAIITDKDGEVKYYGNLVEFGDEDSAAGTAKVTIEGKMESTEVLYVFNEQLNGDKKTDYSSALHEVKIPEKLHSITRHDYVASTCTEDGNLEHYSCVYCNKKFEDEQGTTEMFTVATPEIDHKFGAWRNFDAGQHQRVCEHDSEHVEKEDHKWDAGVVTKPATTMETGVRKYICQVCLATKTEIIDKLPKKENTLTVKGKTVKIKYSKLKKKARTIKRAKAVTVKSPEGKVTYGKAGVKYNKARSLKMSKKAMKRYNKKAVKKITINASDGRIKLKKGLKKGTYKVKVKVKAAGNDNYKASDWKTAIVLIKVR